MTLKILQTMRLANIPLGCVCVRYPRKIQHAQTASDHSISNRQSSCLRCLPNPSPAVGPGVRAQPRVEGQDLEAVL